jgi:hypothetical protein
VAGERSDVLGHSETRELTVPALSAQLWWSFNDRDGMILRFYDGPNVVAERQFADIIEAERFFQKLAALPVRFGRPGASPTEGVGYYWLDRDRWMVQVSGSIADELATDALDRSKAAEAAAEVAGAVRASRVRGG